MNLPLESFVLRLILCILASYRITELIVLDEGPFNIFYSFRRIVGQFASRYRSMKEFGKLINCVFCLGVWISSLMLIPLLLPSIVGDLFLIIFGISGGQSFLSSFGNRWNNDH